MSISGGRSDSCGGADSAIALDVERGAHRIQRKNQMKRLIMDLYDLEKTNALGLKRCVPTQFLSSLLKRSRHGT